MIHGTVAILWVASFPSSIFWNNPFSIMSKPSSRAVSAPQSFVEFFLMWLDSGPLPSCFAVADMLFCCMPKDWHKVRTDQNLWNSLRLRLNSKYIQYIYIYIYMYNSNLSIYINHSQSQSLTVSFSVSIKATSKSATIKGTWKSVKAIGTSKSVTVPHGQCQGVSVSKKHKNQSVKLTKIKICHSHSQSVSVSDQRSIKICHS